MVIFLGDFDLDSAVCKTPVITWESPFVGINEGIQPPVAICGAGRSVRFLDPLEGVGKDQDLPVSRITAIQAAEGSCLFSRSVLSRVTRCWGWGAVHWVVGVGRVLVGSGRGRIPTRE